MLRLFGIIGMRIFCLAGRVLRMFVGRSRVFGSNIR